MDGVLEILILSQELISLMKNTKIKYKDDLDEKISFHFFLYRQLGQFLSLMGIFSFNNLKILNTASTLDLGPSNDLNQPITP